MAHAESNRSPSPARDSETAEPTRAAYRIPKLLKLDLKETEGLGGSGADGASQSGPPT